MTAIESVTLDVTDTEAARKFYDSAFGLGEVVQVRDAEAESTGFRGFTLSLIVSQPGNVDALYDAALGAGATSIKPAKKSMWGYGGVLQAPDGCIWKIATSSKKDKDPVSTQVDDIALLLGVQDMAATKDFYVSQGLEVAKSFGRKYAEFTSGGGAIKLGLYGHAALAKDAGVPADGSGSHRIVINADTPAFTDLDGFTWQPR